MGRVGAVVILENDVLLVPGAVDDLGGTSGKLVLDLVDKRNHDRSNDLEDEKRELLLELLDDLGEDGDLLDSLRYGLEEIVVELDDRHNLTEDLLDVESKLLGLPGGHAHVLKLRVGSVFLDLVKLVLLVAANQAIGDLVQKVAKKAGIAVAAGLKGSLEILDFALGHLIGQFTGDGVQEINTTESASDNGVDGVAGAGNAQLSVAADVGEDIALAHLDKSKLGVVTVGKVICEFISQCHTWRKMPL